MLPVVAYPDLVQHYGEYFAPIFSNQAQMLHFKRYLSGLIVSENVTITGMNAWFLSRTDQSNFNRFLTSACWSEDKLNELRIELLNTSHLTKAKRSGVIIIDDTLVHKTGKKVPFTGSYFEASSGTYSWAQSLVTSHYADGRVSWPINFALYCKREEVREEEFRTNNELACELFEDAHLRKIPAATVLFDAWYLVPELTRKIEAASRDC